MRSPVARARLSEEIERFKLVENPLDLLNEVAQLRAFAADLMERWESIYGVDGALLAWHESFKRGEDAPKPRQLPDFSAIGTAIDRVGVMVDRIHKHKQEGSISLATSTRVVEQLGVAVGKCVEESHLDEEIRNQLLDNIERRWGSIRLDSADPLDTHERSHDLVTP